MNSASYMNNASPQTAETREGEPDDPKIVRLGRYLGGITRSRAPAVCGGPRIAGSSARDPAGPHSLYVAVAAWKPRGFAGSIRMLGPIVEETASDLMYRPFADEGLAFKSSSTTTM
jgi:hypothetical protein